MNPGVVGALAGVIIPVVIFMIPIVAILTKHQQKMAELMRQGGGAAGTNDIAELRHEVQQLKEIVSQQAIQMDDFLANQRKLAALPPAVPNELQGRVGG